MPPPGKESAENEKCHYTRVHAIILALQKKLGGLADTELTLWDSNVSLWQVKSTAQGNALEKALPAGNGRLSCPSTQPWWDHRWNALSGSGLSIPKEMGMSWEAGQEKMIKCLKYLSWEERLGDMGLVSLETRKCRGFYPCAKHSWWEGKEKMLVDFLLWTDKRGRTQPEIAEITFKCKKIHFHLDREVNPGCPKRLWSLHPWKYSKPRRTWSQVTCCSWPWWKGGAWNKESAELISSLSCSLLPYYIWRKISREMERAGLLHINVQRKYSSVDEAPWMGVYSTFHRQALFPCCMERNVTSQWQILGCLSVLSGWVQFVPRDAESFRFCLVTC